MKNYNPLRLAAAASSLIACIILLACPIFDVGVRTINFFGILKHLSSRDKMEIYVSVLLPAIISFVAFLIPLISKKPKHPNSSLTLFLYYHYTTF